MIVSEIISESNKFDPKDVNKIKKEGVVFTYHYICEKMISKISPSINDKICEPSVGKGSFVFALLEYFRKDNDIERVLEFFNTNLYCYDINPKFIAEFKDLVREYFGNFGLDNINFDNILCDDFLLQNQSYDLIIGNPPYVRIQNLDKQYLSKLKEDLISVTLGNVDLYYAFLEKSLKVSKKVSFIIPNSFIKNKSANFIRDLIKDRLSYLFNFGVEKVWKNISTYTCILVCDDKPSDFFQYEERLFKKDVNKSDLSDDVWVFGDVKKNGNNLIDLTNHHSGGLATIKDKAFKIDNIENNKFYIGDFEIEKGICQKYIKGTTDRDFNEHKWIIYPYDNNGNVLSEEYISKNFPKCYRYFCGIKDILLSRDKGKTDKYDAWYSYGRRQGLLKEIKGSLIILPISFSKERGIHYIKVPENEVCLTMSGILVDVKKDRVNDFIDIISSDNFYDYCEMNNKVLGGKSNDIWLSVTSNTIKKYIH